MSSILFEQWRNDLWNKPSSQTQTDPIAIKAIILSLFMHRMLLSTAGRMLPDSKRSTSLERRLLMSRLSFVYFSMLHFISLWVIYILNGSWGSGSLKDIVCVQNISVIMGSKKRAHVKTDFRQTQSWQTRPLVPSKLNFGGFPYEVVILPAFR